MQWQQAGVPGRACEHAPPCCLPAVCCEPIKHPCTEPLHLHRSPAACTRAGHPLQPPAASTARPGRREVGAKQPGREPWPTRTPPCSPGPRSWRWPSSRCAPRAPPAPPPVASCRRLAGSGPLPRAGPVRNLCCLPSAQLSQAGAATPSVEDILHLEKRWAKLPGASAGGVSLEDATALLGAEVLAVRASWKGGVGPGHAGLHDPVLELQQLHCRL